MARRLKQISLQREIKRRIHWTMGRRKTNENNLFYFHVILVAVQDDFFKLFNYEMDYKRWN